MLSAVHGIATLVFSVRNVQVPLWYRSRVGWITSKVITLGVFTLRSSEAPCL